jgi:hypothetical protein
VDDSYNANPDSVLAAIDVLAELPAPRLLVLGDMGEVGEQGLAFHLEVLRHARLRGIESVQLCGEWMRQAVQALEGGQVPIGKVVARRAFAAGHGQGDGGCKRQRRAAQCAGQGLPFHEARACGAGCARPAGSGWTTTRGQRPCCLV